MGEDGATLGAARAAYARRDWRAAHDGFAEAARGRALQGDDVYALAEASWWLGAVDEALTAYEQAYQRYLDAGQRRRAAMTAMEVAVSLFLRGEAARGSGWTSRAERLLRDEPECPEHGYALYLQVEARLDGAEPAAVVADARQVQEIGQRCADPNLVACGRLAEGRALLRQGRVADGMGLLDEAMLAALSDDMDPAWTGNVYCHLITACHELADVRRASEWNDALERWCAQVSPAVLFAGICRVHRAQFLRVEGAWERAEEEAWRVCGELESVHVASVAEARYEIGQIRRLRGDLKGAEEAYAEANRLGRDPQPGLALLRLAQGRMDAAVAAIGAALAGSNHPLGRAPLLAAQVEVALAADDLDGARRAADELGRSAARYASSGLEAMAAHARGAVLLAGGDAGPALQALRDACRRWQELQAPYDAARARVLLALAYRQLGDGEAATRELDGAAAVFERLGAVPDARHVAGLRSRGALPGGLSAREAEVLALVAAGKTNRAVARELVISEKTVARHLSNIFAKLGVSSRTQAAAFAFAHDLARREDG